MFASFQSLKPPTVWVTLVRFQGETFWATRMARVCTVYLTPLPCSAPQVLDPSKESPPEPSSQWVLRPAFVPQAPQRFRKAALMFSHSLWNWHNPQKTRPQTQGRPSRLTFLLVMGSCSPPCHVSSQSLQVNTFVFRASSPCPQQCGWFKLIGILFADFPRFNI